MTEEIRRDDDVLIIKQKNKLATLLAALGLVAGLLGMGLGWSAYNMALDARNTNASTRQHLDESIDRVMNTLDQAAPGNAADANNPPATDSTPNATPNAGGQ